MCFNNLLGNGNCIWIIIIILLLFSCGNNTCCNNTCGCETNCNPCC
ncbi:MAG: hypothetical protein IJP23_01265 [Oscillospiraceae bacterium]|nr:hypothetical protein [Oscillospiraceae bacterium]